MRATLLLAICCWSMILSGQVSNKREVLVKNGVKQVRERHCFPHSDGTCRAIWTAYDRRGNMTEWNMGRLGTRYLHTYDDRNNMTCTIWVDKWDSTDVDSFPKTYDRFDNVVMEFNGNDTLHYQHEYDNNGRLRNTKQGFFDGDSNWVSKNTTWHWTTFDSLYQKITTIVTTPYGGDTSSSTLEQLSVVNELNDEKMLIKSTSYKGIFPYRIVTYRYDDQGRLIEKQDVDSARMARANRRKEAPREDIDAFVTRIQYNEAGQIAEKYAYTSDPCMSLDNHYRFVHHYHDHGLLDYVDVFETKRLVFTIKYEYEFFDDRR